MIDFLFYTELCFWIILILIFHCYLIFPLTLPFLSEIFRRNKKYSQSKKLFKVSILISAYNEEKIIEEKILNLLELDYPKELLEILIGDDGSSDKTVEIIKRYQNEGIHLIQAPQNAGKAAMLNRLQKEATGEILLFCDANTLFFPNVIRKLITPFSDPKIGCSCGHLILSDFSGTILGQGESSYWDLESEIKRFEGSLDRLIGGNGALYAIRNSLYTPLPTKKSVMDDFYITIKILQKGYLCTFIPTALGTEQTSKEAIGEFRRKVRIGRANFNYLFSYLSMLNPLKPLLAYLFVSHKLLRWFTPHLGVLLFISNSILLFSKKPIYIISFILFSLFLAIGYFKIIPSVYYFLSMNLALLKGFFLSFSKEKSGGWQREERTDLGSATSKWTVILLLVFGSFFAENSHALLTLDASFGGLTAYPDPDGIHVNLGGHFWIPIDQMLFVGLGADYQEIGSEYFVPLTGSAWLRLPIGTHLMPVVTGDFGYAVGSNPQFVWQAGGGLDLKNGDNSSIIIIAGYQRLKKTGNYFYIRAGFLIEI